MEVGSCVEMMGVSAGGSDFWVGDAQPRNWGGGGRSRIGGVLAEKNRSRVGAE